MILSFSKLNHLSTNPYRVYTNNEMHTGTATVHCRNEKTGKLLPVELVTIITDDDFAATVEDVANEYERLRRSKKID